MCRGSTPPHGAGVDIIIGSSRSSIGGCGVCASVCAVDLAPAPVTAAALNASILTASSSHRGPLCRRLLRRRLDATLSRVMWELQEEGGYPP